MKRKIVIVVLAVIVALNIIGIASFALGAEISGDGTNIMSFSGRFESGDASRFMHGLSGNDLTYMQNHGLDIYINSPGGSAPECITIIALLSKWSNRHLVHITTHAPAKVASAGAMLFLMGDERVLGEVGMIMFHYAAFSNRTGERITTEKELSQIPKPYRDQLKRMNKLMVRLLKEKTTLPLGHLEDEIWMFAEEALKYKVATRIEIIGKGGRI